MSFPRYPAYKPSGVEWLGDVPEHWEVKPLKRLAEIQTGLAKGKEVEPEGSIEVPFLRVANVQDDFLDLENVHTILIPESSLERYLLRPGDVLMNEGGDFDKLGRGCIWDGTISPCIHQNHVFAVRPHLISPSWLNAYTSSIQANSYFISRSKQSTNLASISSSNLMDLLVPVAPDLETKKILDFLDHETAKIDALIAEQQRLIELLQEKRQAVISHAVTKGLNPDAPMKDSGVERLGEMPEHWNRTALKFVGDYQNGYPFKPEDRGTEGLPIIRISQLTGNDEPAYYSGDLDERVKVRDGDLLFTWSATIDSFIWDKGEAWLNQHIFRVSPSAEADKRYLYYVIKHVAPKVADFDAHGSTMRHIKKESLGEKVYVPSD